MKGHGCPLDNSNYYHHNEHPAPEELINILNGSINPTFKKDTVKVNGNRIDFLTNSRDFKSEGSEFVFTSTSFMASGNAAGMPQINGMVSGKSSPEKSRILSTMAY